MEYSLLNLCARINVHPQHKALLTAACTTFTQWDKLVLQAETHGMSPLLYKHLSTLDAEIPLECLRSLKMLSLRHHQANTLRMKALHSILSLFASQGLPCLVLKGAALCQTLYPASGLRPMRDIDLLLARNDTLHAHACLQQNGFRPFSVEIPKEYFHLAPLFLEMEGLHVCVELHHGLFPDDPPYYQTLSFAALSQKAQVFTVKGQEASCLADEEMLWHLYQHAFHAPLTYEAYRLIAAADIISLIEERVDTIDWDKMRTTYRECYNILPLFHYLTPWKDNVLEKIPELEQTPPSGVGATFNGWPRKKFIRKEGTTVWSLIRQTLFPAQWWLMMYYGSTGRLSLFWCILARHPLHLLRWVKVYSRLFLQTKKTAENTNIR